MRRSSSVCGAESLWDVRSAAGDCTRCSVTPMTDGRYLLLVERNSLAVVAQVYRSSTEAIDRAGSIYWELIHDGWTAASGVS